MFGFIFGALAGGVAAWYYRDQIQGYVEKTLPNVRSKAADQLSSLEHRAEEALTRAKSQIDRIRPEDQHRVRSAGGQGSGSYTHGTGV